MISHVTVTYVTVTVTQSHITQKSIEGSEIMILYSIFTIY